MKIFGFLFFFLMSITCGFSQLKVITNGFTKIGNTATDVPTERLDVSGDVRIRGSQLYIGDEAGNGGVTVHVGRDRTANGNTGFSFYNNTSGSHTLRLAVSGTGTSSFTHLGTAALVFKNQNAADMVFKTSNLNRLFIRSNGNVDVVGSLTVNGGTAVTSDKRLKRNIQDFKPGLNELMEIRPVSYQYNGTAGTLVDRPYVGVVAQELQKVLPNFVSEHEFVVDDNNGEKLETENYLKIHDSELKYVIINAIQEQQKIIDDQAKRINDLESMINDLSQNQISTQSINWDGQTSKLGNNIPNPFSDKTSIEYFVPQNTKNASIRIIDVSGQVIKTVNIIEKGQGLLEVNALNVPAGIYNYQLLVDNKVVDTKKMVLTK